MTNNPWVIHVKNVAKENGINFGDALKIAGATYNKQGGKGIGHDILNGAHRLLKRHKLVSKGLTHIKEKYVPSKFHGIADAVTNVVKQEGYGKKRRARK